MSNSILTPTQVTREALRILHQKLNFVGSIDRQYDSQFANEGAKIGDTLKIRKPNQYVVTDGKTLNTQDTAEESVTLQVSSQKHVGMNFSSADLTLSLDDFSKRIIEPAMSVLAANVEYTVMSNVYKDIYNSVWDSAGDLAYSDVLDARTKVQYGLAPLANRTANLNSLDMVDVIKDTKTLFNDQAQIAKQYKEGFMGRAAGFDFVENTMWPGHTTGSEDGNYVVNTSSGITSGTATITTTGGSGTLSVGDVFTVGGVYAVHPETKAQLPHLQQFTVTAAVTGTGAWAVSPTPVTSGAKQNITIVSAGSGKAVTVEGTASTAHRTSLVYQKEAFTFATADLVLPKGVDFARREVMDGISLRLIRDYDINNDNLPCRVDVLFGYQTLRPEFACRLHMN